MSKHLEQNPLLFLKNIHLYSYLVLGVSVELGQRKPKGVRDEVWKAEGEERSNCCLSYWFIVWFGLALLEMFPKAPECEEPS